jgi:hypothetical protein
VLNVSYDASRKDKRELLSDWVAIMRQLRDLGVIRTNNNPIGDIAEAIVCDHYGGQRGSFSQKGWDVKTPDGERIQVKSRRKTPHSKPTVLSPISDDEYDSLVVVIFNEDFQVTEGLRASRALVEGSVQTRQQESTPGPPQQVESRSRGRRGRFLGSLGVALAGRRLTDRASRYWNI